MGTDDLENEVMKRRPKRKVKNRDWLSTGSTLLNLACSDHPRRGFLKGHYYFLVGDSTSGKTWLSLTCLAEASINRYFQEHRFIFDDVEGGALMNIRKYFGKTVASKMELPAVDSNGNAIPSRTIEDFFDNVNRAIDQDEPFIYVLDSMDALSSEQEQEKIKKQRKAREQGKDSAGTMTDGKAKKNSENIRQILGGLKDTGSILIIINQTRDNIGFGFEKKTRSGGHALTFYATLEIWSSVKGKLKKTVRKKERQIGTMCKIRTRKNRSTGKDRITYIPIYHSFGIDDIGSCIEYLLDEKYWSKEGNTIDASDFEFKGTFEKLVHHIEDNELERDLQNLVGKLWKEIELACSVKRKSRYE